MILVVFSRRWTKSYLPGVFGAIFMVSAFGFVRVHLSRSADLDATLLLFTTAFTFLFLDLLLVGIKHNKYLLPISGLVLLAFLSKSLAGFLPLFPLFLLALVTKRGRSFLQNRNTWFYILGCLVLVAFYYFIRNLIQPEYFEMVWNSEFLRLTHNVMPWHKQPFHFYVLNFVKLNFYTPHIFVLPVAILLLLFSKNRFVQKMTVYLSCFILFFLLLISFPVVKLEWYDASFYPVSSFILGLALWNYGKHWTIWTAILLFAMLFPYRSVLEFYHERIYPTEPLEREGNFMRSLYHEKPTIRNYDVYMEVQTSEHLDQMFFYQKNLNWYKGYQIEYKESNDQIAKSDTVLCCQAKAIEKLQDNFKTLVIIQNRDCKLMVIEQ
jgi:4-amino-4-deoxy-L-arabinose transferase-like glycosyltransferase